MLLPEPRLLTKMTMPHAGRRSAQQKNTLQRYFPMRGQDMSMTSPPHNQNENSAIDSFAVKEAQWQAEREKLMSELERAT